VTTETYEIVAIKYGEYAARRRSDSFIMADDHDAPHPIDYFVWLVRNANRTIMVDCGFEETEAAKRGRRIARTPAGSLPLLGTSAEKVDQLIVTHLHYDQVPPAGRGDVVCHRPLHVPQPPALSLHRRAHLRHGPPRLLRPRDLP
jgi:glyoxylase-like metal-dependent hydrolase (beta-lactamase superfamily II)